MGSDLAKSGLRPTPPSIPFAPERVRVTGVSGRPAAGRAGSAIAAAAAAGTRPGCAERTESTSPLTAPHRTRSGRAERALPRLACTRAGGVLRRAARRVAAAPETDGAAVASTGTSRPDRP